MLEIDAATCSEPGQRTVNEDASCWGQAGRVYHAVVSDGAGGHERGAQASAQVVAQVEMSLAAAAVFDSAALANALLSAHMALQACQVGATGRQRMHATAVVLWLDTRANLALWSHVGDSRLYRFRYGTVELLTTDDSVVQRLLEGGALTPEQAEDHPLKNRLLAALGMQESVEPHTSARPVPLEDGDAFLLCSDGWWGALDEAAMASTLLDADTPAGWLQAMRARIAARRVSGQDNYTAIAAWVVDPAESTQSMDEAGD